MANELNTAAPAGLTITASLVQGVTVVASDIAIASTAVPRYYSGSVPINTPAGVYAVVFTDGTRTWVGELRWDGAAEVLPAPVADVAAVPAAVRAALATELARVDVNVSTRSTYAGADTAGTSTLLARIPAAPLLAAAYVAPDNASITAIKAKTDALPASIATPSDVAAVPAAVWSAPVRTITGGGTGGSSVSASDLADAVLDATAGDATVRAALSRVNEVPGTGPVDPVPGPPTSTGTCRVYGYFSTPDGRPLNNAELIIMLEPASVLASARIVGLHKMVLKTDSEGRLAGTAGPYLDLMRNDQLTGQAGVTETWYRVTCRAIGADGVKITLDTPVADLRELLLAATP